MRDALRAVLYNQQNHEDDERGNWASIGEPKSSSEDDKQHQPASGGVDTSIHALREKNRCMLPSPSATAVGYLGYC